MISHIWPQLEKKGVLQNEMNSWRQEWTIVWPRTTWRNSSGGILGHVSIMSIWKNPLSQAVSNNLNEVWTRDRRISAGGYERIPTGIGHDLDINMTNMENLLNLNISGRWKGTSVKHATEIRAMLSGGKDWGWCISEGVVGMDDEVSCMRFIMGGGLESSMGTLGQVAAWWSESCSDSKRFVTLVCPFHSIPSGGENCGLSWHEDHEGEVEQVFHVDVLLHPIACSSYDIAVWQLVRVRAYLGTNCQCPSKISIFELNTVDLNKIELWIRPTTNTIVL